MINKTCRQCNANFVVEDEDFEFYKKMSPEFDGKTFDIPAPTLCPDCRDQRRMVWRNERHLYNRKSDKSGSDIVSIYSPDKTQFKIYSIPEWWADDWDAINYGFDYDPKKSFFKQIDVLLKSVPRMALFNTNTQNCEYANYAAECKNCYMSVVSYYNTENTHYSFRVYNCKNNLDLYSCTDVENSYECIDCDNCYGCTNSLRLSDCRNCRFCIDLIECNDCVLCSNLTRKKYCIENKQYTKDDYLRKIVEINFGSFEEISGLKKKFFNLRKKSIVKYANIINSVDCTGDNLINCKNVKESFDCHSVENSKFTINERAKDSYDTRGGSLELSLESNHVGGGSMFVGCSSVLGCSSMYYCENCYFSHDCFACVGLKHKEFCIFNKQFSKEEYQKKVVEIIGGMIEKAEWGEFFPVSLSPFGYNETVAHENCSLSKLDALRLKASWQDRDFSLKYTGEFYEPKDDIADYENSEKNRNALLSGVLECESSGRPFKIMPQELALYIELGVPIPHEHYGVRHKNRFKMRNPKVLYHRRCMCEESGHDHTDPSSAEATDGKRCLNEFETTYAPERPEKVYCENCYQKTVI